MVEKYTQGRTKNPIPLIYYGIAILILHINEVNCVVIEFPFV